MTTIQLTGAWIDRPLAEGFVLRAAPVPPCPSPLCRCKAGEVLHVLFVGDEVEDSWVCKGAEFEADIEAFFQSFEHEEIEMDRRVAALIGIAWIGWLRKADLCNANQSAALITLPPRFFQPDVPLEGLRRLRAQIHEGNPANVVALLQIMDAYAMDLGGTRGPT